MQANNNPGSLCSAGEGTDGIEGMGETVDLSSPITVAKKVKPHYRNPKETPYPKSSKWTHWQGFVCRIPVTEASDAMHAPRA